MTAKAKKGAAVNKGKKAAGAAAPKKKVEADAANDVVEVSEEQKASAVEEPKAAPPPVASDTEHASEETKHQPEQNKPTEREAEAIAEQLVAGARKPLTKNESQSSLAGSVTVGIAGQHIRINWHSLVLQADATGTSCPSCQQLLHWVLASIAPSAGD